jgi:Mg2+-importing ATPase
MIHLTQFLGTPVVDASGEEIGRISDLAIETREVFPRVTAIAFLGPDRTPFMLSWRKFVEDFDEERIKLNSRREDLRFSYQQPNEVLLSRDLLNKDIIDTQGKKVVRVRDLELVESKNQLRLLGAEVGIRGMLRSISPILESAITRVSGWLGRSLRENLIAWNYMELLDRDLSHVKLSMTHKRLHELHPADIADIIEQLPQSRRARVFELLDDAAAASAISEMQDELQADAIEALTLKRASSILEEMDADDAADIISDLPYEKAEKLLRLMGLKEQRAIRNLLGFRENSAGGIMKPATAIIPEDMTAHEVIEYLRANPSITDESQHLYVVRGPEDRRLVGRVSLRDIVIAEPDIAVRDLVTPNVVTVQPEDDQEHVAETMAKYDLLSLPVVDEVGTLLGVVTLDDVIEIVQRLRAGPAPRAPRITRKPVEEPDLLLQVASVSPQQALSVLESSPEGLDEETARRRLSLYGPNVISPRKRLRWYSQLFSSFRSPFNGILALLAVASYLTDVRFAADPDLSKIIIISVMILASGLVRFFQEYRSARMAADLQEIVRTTALVLRRPGEAAGVETGGDLESLLSPELMHSAREIPVEQIVPGDIVYLHAGDLVPADMRILVSRDLFVSESSLTGESLPVEKHARAVRSSFTELPATALEAETLCFMGTSVTSGSAAGVVIATGASTYLGSLGQELVKKPEPTAFDRGVKGVSWVLLGFMGAMVPLVFLFNLYGGKGALDSGLFALAVAVGLTPEMLPMIVSGNLAKGSIRLSRHKVIVKQMSAIQNLGSIDVLCTDKTGTLTEDRVVLERHVDLEGRDSPDVLRLAYINSYFQTGLRNLLDDAVLDFAGRLGLADQLNGLEKVDEVPFDFSRKRLSIIVRDGDGRPRLICKGAVEKVLAASSTARMDGEALPLTPEVREKALARVRELNEEGMRVLAVGYRDITRKQRRFSPEDERELVLVGFIGFLDPPKESAAEAVSGLRQLGVEVKVLTGDNETVARAVCEKVGIPVGRIISGGLVERMSDEELAVALEKASVVARLDPLQKARIVRVLKESGRTVGFMGDGINDAAALQAADVGISVDSAVDIAKESADIILLEKSLTVLENGIAEGRSVFANIMKYIKITASSNFGNVFSVLAASALLPFLPMLPLQLLFLNLLYDLSCLSIPFDRVDRDFILRPRRWDSRSLVRFMLFLGPVSSVYDLVTFAVMYFIFSASTPEHQALFQSGWFVASMFTQLLVIQVLRTDRKPFLESRASLPVLLAAVGAATVAAAVPFTALGRSLGLTGLPGGYWPLLLAIVTAYVFHAQGVKWAYRQRFGGEWL